MATLPQFVIHVQRHDHRHIHVDELGCEVEVTFQVRGIHHVDDDIRCLLDDIFSYIEFFRRVSRQTVGARQVHDVECVTLELHVTHFRIDRHTRVVAYMLVRLTCYVEQTGLAAVRITHERHEDMLSPCFSHRMTEVAVLSYDARSRRLVLTPFIRLSLGHHFHQIRFGTTQTHLVVHHLIFHGILQRRVQHHLHLRSFDEPHLYDAFPESAVTIHFCDDRRFSCFQFR